MDKSQEDQGLPLKRSNSGMIVELQNGTSVDITSKEGEEILSKSVDHEKLDLIINEIKDKRKKLTIKQVIACIVGFVLVCLLTWLLFPRISMVDIDDAWSELRDNPRYNETEDFLLRSLDIGEDGRTHISEKKAKGIAIKYRTVNIQKNYNDYMDGVDQYLNTFRKLINQFPTNIWFKECYIEGVLKSFPWDEDSIALKKYADEIKNSGDKRFGKRSDQLVSVCEYCDYMLESFEKDSSGIDKIGKKKVSVKLQKAQLLMYMWLVENVKKKKGRPVSGFPDDKGDCGVNFREQAVAIIENDLINTSEGRRLYNQCIDVLIEDSSKLNRIYFGGAGYYRHKTLLKKKLEEGK